MALTKTGGREVLPLWRLDEIEERALDERSDILRYCAGRSRSAAPREAMLFARGPRMTDVLVRQRS
jgi:hypothetical protein